MHVNNTATLHTTFLLQVVEECLVLAESVGLRDTLEDLGVDGRIFKWILKSGMGAWTGLVWLRIGPGGGLL